MLSHQSDCSGKELCLTSQHMVILQIYGAKANTTGTDNVINTYHHMSTCPSLPSESVQTLFFVQFT